MTSKSRKPHKTQCFRKSENPENSRRSAQNASKTSTLHVEFAVAIVIKKPSKITPKWPKKNQKSTPRWLQDGPFGNFKCFKMMINIKSTSGTPRRSPRGPQQAPKSPQEPSKNLPKRPQKAPRRPPKGPRAAINIMFCFFSYFVACFLSY